MPARRPTLLTLAPPATALVVQRAARAEGLDVEVASSLADFLARLRARARHAALVSLAAEGVDAAIVQSIARESNAGALILATPTASFERALLAERIGAFALLSEPLVENDLRARLRDALDEGPEVPLPDDADDPEEADGPPRLIGEGPPMAAVFETIARAARSTSTVLVTGESGTGKEVVARALHWASERRGKPFVAVNCAAIPEHLLESELFGHERGAFTGAVARRVGRFERAQGGTLFLDEIGDMGLVLQAKVLRALEERVVEPVGGDEGRPVDVRVVAATNQDLVRAVANGRFREDLYYRLAVVEVWIPPLRERGADVRVLALHFAARFARRHGRRIEAITEAALRRLEAAPWPGNVRELRNVMDRAVLLARGRTVRGADLRLGPGAPSAAPRTETGQLEGYPPNLTLEEVEARHIRRVLEAVSGHIGKAAEVLGIHRNTLTRKLKAYGIDATES
jgi:two-component system response regulator HydG